MKDKPRIVEDWLPRYTGVPLNQFGDYILLTNFSGYLGHFARLSGRLMRPRSILQGHRTRIGEGGARRAGPVLSSAMITGAAYTASFLQSRSTQPASLVPRDQPQRRFVH
jgi:hypothetical protein